MSGQIQKLRQRKADLVTEADALAAKDAEGTITEEETARYTAILDVELPKINASIEREERLMDERRTMTAVPVVPEVEDATAETHPRVTTPKQGSFKTFGEQLQSIARAGMHSDTHWSNVDNRLVYQAAGSGANEEFPSEGGFLVQQDFSTAFLNTMVSGSEILSRVRRFGVSANANGIKFPAIDETSRTNGSRFGGVQGYWLNEGDTKIASKPRFRMMDLQLKKVAALGYATDEMLQDSSIIEQIFNTAFGEELRFKTEDAIINGTGAGQPLGILNSGALVTITPESGQAASSIRIGNILSMWMRTPIRSRRSLIWLSNQDIEAQLWNLTDLDTATIQLYQLPGQAGNTSPYGLLMGRPVVPIEYAASLGTVGDLILWDPQEYVLIDKGGVQSASSMHVKFESDEQTFRVVYRVDGQPVWRSAVTPYKGSNTLSPYVALGTR